MTTINMTMLKQLVLLGLAVTLAAALDGEVPDCDSCDYDVGGVGFVKSNVVCSLYYTCVKNSHGYAWWSSCCAPGLEFDNDHLACLWQKSSTCVEDRSECPPEEPIRPYATDLTCPYEEDPDNPSGYIVIHTGQKVTCPGGAPWIQGICHCGYPKPGEQGEACDKLLRFEFSGSFDSDVCANWAKGVPVGGIRRPQDSLVLNGDGQYLNIPFLSNWFTWNPSANAFTICLWFNGDEQTAGLFSTNCNSIDGDAELDISVNGLDVVANLAGTVVNSGGGVQIGVWNKVCVTYSQGNYRLYLNGALVAGPVAGARLASHNPSSVGFASGHATFNGAIDNVCMWSRALSDADILACYDDGREDIDDAP